MGMLMAVVTVGIMSDHSAVQQPSHISTSESAAVSSSAGAVEQETSTCEGAASAHKRSKRQQGFRCLHPRWKECGNFADPMFATFTHAVCTCTEAVHGTKCDKSKLMVCKCCPISRLPVDSTVVQACDKPKKAHVDTCWCNPVAGRTPGDVRRNGEGHIEAERGWHKFWAAVDWLTKHGHPPITQNGVEQQVINVRQCYLFLNRVKTVYKEGGMLSEYDNQAKFDNAEKVIEAYAAHFHELPKFVKRVSREAGKAGESGQAGAAGGATQPSAQWSNFNLLADAAVSVASERGGATQP